MILSPFTIAYDTREQLPFSFADIRIDRKKAFVMTQRRTLPTGDYSIIGYEENVCVERKSLADLYQTLGKGRERFLRELERMQTMDYSAVVIEATWQQIAYPTYDNPLFYSKMNPNAVIETIRQWEKKRFPKTEWIIAKNRHNAEMITFRLLLNYWKNTTTPLDTNDNDASKENNNSYVAGEQAGSLGDVECACKIRVDGIGHHRRQTE